ncbi:right-handed parallel beta-helix repeat-containing protein [Longimicrobium sp.]|uniref:right-handed parallel beta-helix repeat-containing protein n=1 Tax=Longimicrobium sp. TaxID=2029185 RepID=UPI002E304B3A|nr:right-handed parallel beta-helix repeat-containing protein [Longimicrobium sp.]HEX6037667.1 right-handed parallel beta-helix repeat-containing protein [Longimicrobium sp.]
MRSHNLVVTLSTLSLLAACADQPTAPAAPDAAPRLAQAGACAASPTYVVHTDPELRAALASAGAGDVIAVSGTIALDSVVVVETAGVTITCAERGAGLEFAPGNRDILLDLYADGITVSGLRLDAEYGYSPFLALTPDADGMQDIRLIGNDVECGYFFCLFAVGVPGIQITDNHFEGENTRYGLQIQGVVRRSDGSYTGGSDGAVITRNVIENEGGYPGVYGGIRVRDGVGVTVTHNDVLGDWSNGIVLTNIYDSRVEHNRVDGALLDGIDLAMIVANRVSVSNVSFKANRISNSGRTGIGVRGACYNTFQGNNVNDNAVGARFEHNTGANVWRGSNEVVQDGGAFDCDLDGDIDPNQISGVQSQPLPDTLPGLSLSASAAQATAGRRGLPAVQ